MDKGAGPAALQTDGTLRARPITANGLTRRVIIRFHGDKENVQAVRRAFIGCARNIEWAKGWVVGDNLTPAGRAARRTAALFQFKRLDEGCMRPRWRDGAQIYVLPHGGFRPRPYTEEDLLLCPHGANSGGEMGGAAGHRAPGGDGSPRRDRWLRLRSDWMDAGGRSLLIGACYITPESSSFYREERPEAMNAKVALEVFAALQARLAAMRHARRGLSALGRRLQRLVGRGPRARGYQIYQARRSTADLAAQLVVVRYAFNIIVIAESSS
jgi:hypothetical protein